MPLLFGSNIIWRRYRLFVILWFHEDIEKPPYKWKKDKRAYIPFKWCLIQKIKALYNLQLLKLKKEKCTHFYDQSSYWWFRIILSFHKDTENPSEVTNWQKAHIFLKWHQIKKLKALYFLQLLKLKGRKYTYFFNWR